MNTNTFLQCNVSVSFLGQTNPFFNNLQATFAMGQLHFIKGRNGVGKSTLFRLMQGIINPGEQAQGSVTISDQSYALTDNKLAGMVKAVPQRCDDVLVPLLSVQECLQLAKLAMYPGITSLPVVFVKPILSAIGIMPSMLIKDLSGGQRQLLAIVMMLQKNPQVLLLDEPTAALDHANARLILDMLVQLCTEAGITMLIITHDMELLATYAQSGYAELVQNNVTGMREMRSHVLP